MAEENVKVDLKSTADTSGFEKFESSYNSLRAAKLSHANANGAFVDSERRVRTNLVDLVGGLSNARDGMDATAAVVQHLSEVFKVGFVGTVIAGVGAAIVEQFAKADEAIAKTREEIEKSIDELKTLDAEITGRKQTPEQKEEAALRKQTEGFAKSGQEIGNMGFFKTAAIGLEHLTGIGSAETNFMQARADQTLRSELLGQSMTDLSIAKQKDFYEKLGSLDQFSFSKDKPRGGGMGTRDMELAVEREESDREAEKRRADEAEKAARVKEEADRKKDQSAREASEKAARDQAAAEREDAKDDRDDRRQGRIKATILAGGQRQLGGGGGVYSNITRDPVVEEARKHTTLLQEISNTLKSNEPASAGGLGVTLA